MKLSIHRLYGRTWGTEYWRQQGFRSIRLGWFWVKITYSRREHASTGSLKMALLRLHVTLLRVRHERPMNHWLETRAQYRQDHDWL